MKKTSITHKLLHVSADYLLGIESELSLSLDDFTQEEISLVYQLLKYFDSKK